MAILAVSAVIAMLKMQMLSPQNTVGWWKSRVRSSSTCRVAAAVLYQPPVPGTSGHPGHCRHRVWKERSEPTAALSPKRVSLLSRISPIQVRTLLAVTRGDPGRDHTYLGGCLVPSPQWGVGWPVAFQALWGLRGSLASGQAAWLLLTPGTLSSAAGQARWPSCPEHSVRDLERGQHGFPCEPSSRL